MIAVVDVAVQAANVSMPLFPWRAFRNSYSSVRVRNVPRKIGKWNITNVTVQVTYPDGSIKTADAVLTGGVWVATVEGTATAGTSLQGYKILASGIDENGQPVSNYCLGRGDVTILEDDGELIPENVITYTRLLSAEPTAPKDGDLWQLSGSWYIYQDGTSYPIGDDSGLIRQLSSELSNKADISSLTAYVLSSELSNYVLSSDLSSKQDKLSDAQVSAIDSVVDERKTVITFTDNTTSVFNWSGEITQQTMIDAGLFDEEEDAWIKNPKSVKIGTAVMNIGSYAFDRCTSLTSVTIPDSVTSIGEYAFWGCSGLTGALTIPNSVTSIESYVFVRCSGLTSVTIPNSVSNIGEDVFFDCTNLANITVVGKTQAQAEELLDIASVPEGCEITTWNDASQEWVKEQGYLTSIPNTYKTYNDTLSFLSSDGYATTAYAVHSLSGVANITSMPLSSYEAISATADVETLYVITED